MATMVQLVCSNCGRQFERKKGKRPPSKHNTYFCCRECGFEWKRKRRSLITVACTHCGAAHDRMPSEIRPDNAGTFFCSVECRRDYEQGRRVELTCDMCGDVYERSASQVCDDQKHYFCSGGCRQAWEKRGNEQAHCRQCGIPIERTVSDIKSSKSRFCSMECRGAWEASQWLTLCCDECGASFDRHKTKVYDRNFCSAACRARGVGRSQRGANHPNWVEKVQITCETCGKPVDKNPSAVHHDHVFCSPQCRIIWMSEYVKGERNPLWAGRVEIPCDHCGKPIERLPKQAEAFDHSFCNARCRANWMSENLSGPNSKLWQGGDYGYYYGPGWALQAERARERDNHKCQHCGVTEDTLRRKLDVHHIRPFRTFGYIVGENDNYRQANDLSNLISLCSSCHVRVEAGKISI